MNQKKLKQYEATKNDPEKAIEQPVYGKTTVIRLILEVLRYSCGQSDLTSISAQSLKDAFKLTYYFIAGAQKALKKFHSDPLGTLTEKQRSIYLDLPSVFTTREGLSIVLQHSMSERTFKDWIKTATFKKLDYGTYGKRYGIYRIL